LPIPTPGVGIGFQAVCKGRVSKIDSKELALRIVDAAKEKLGEQVTVLDMRALTSFCDYFVIVSAGSMRQVNAISDAVQFELAKDRRKPLSSVSSSDQSGWIVLDYNSVVAHIFYEPMREFYALEHLWADAKKVRLSKKIVAKKL
jgi:ribosome-associated protein